MKKNGTDSDIHNESSPVILNIEEETEQIGTGPKISELDQYIREQMDFMQEAAENAENRKSNWDRLEEFFRSAVL